MVMMMISNVSIDPFLLSLYRIIFTLFGEYPQNNMLKLSHLEAATNLLNSNLEESRYSRNFTVIRLVGA